MWLLTVPFSKSNKTRGDLLYNKDLHSCLALRPNLKSKLFFSYGVEKQSGFDSGEKKKKTFLFGSSRATFKPIPLRKCSMPCEKYYFKFK